MQTTDEALLSATALLDTWPAPAAVLDADRRIRAVNRAFLELAGRTTAEQARGRSPGEVLGCAFPAARGRTCGPASPCSACGLGRILAKAGRGEVAEDQFTVLAPGGDAGEMLSLRARAAPLPGPEPAIALFVRPVADDEHRRRDMELVFLHDVLNSATGLQTLLWSLRTSDAPAERAELSSLASAAVEQVVAEIVGHRALLAAEDGSLEPEWRPVPSGRLLRSVLESYRRHPLSEGRALEMVPGSVDVSLLTDPSLLSRVLGNLVRNALEATPERGVVTAGASRDGDRVEFRVHNEALISEAARRVIFRRPFSTKGPGRGFGTYGVRLIAEGFLGARVSFESTRGRGTTFIVSCPIARP